VSQFLNFQFHTILTSQFQVGSSDSPSISKDPSTIANDLRALADLLAPHSFRLAYEPWAWSTHAPTWKSTHEIIKLVDRPNAGLCFDTFQIAGFEWADPTTSSGLIDNRGFQQKLEMNFAGSLIELTQTVPREKIYLLQISDAYKLSVPLKPDVQNEKGEIIGQGEGSLRARGRWSHDYRPYPFNGGFLPVVQVTKAVLGTGFRGWFSMEIFDSGADGKAAPGTGQREGMSEEEMVAFCKGAMESHRRLLEVCADSEG
jgi:sugar phosphate isomerase/epimerase